MSTAAASGATLAAALVVLLSAPSHFVPLPESAPTHDRESQARHITYVSPAPPRPVSRVQPKVLPRTREPRRPALASRPQARAAPPEQHSIVSDSSAGQAPNATPPAVSDFERRWTAHGVSPLLVPSAAPGAPYAGKSEASGPLVRIPPSSGADQDAELRAKELAAIAARSTGAPSSAGSLGGVSIDAPIPFGGPSRAQRKRDSIINAQTQVVLVRVRQHLDSIAAARKQKRVADSLAALGKRP